jgi:hypothetical protein
MRLSETMKPMEFLPFRTSSTKQKRKKSKK